MTTTEYAPDKPCQRTTGCVDAGPHLGKAHIDPRDPLYDGPHTSLGAAPMAARKAARALLDAGAPMPEVMDLVNIILEQRRQHGHLMVDKDHAVRAAMTRALDCNAHGEDLKALAEQASHFSRQAEKHDRARTALLGLLHQIRDTVRVMQDRIKLGQPLPDGKEFVEALDKAAKKASAAHDRAWSK